MVGAILGDGWCNIGAWLVRCLVMVGPMFGNVWHNTGRCLVE